MLYWRNTTKSIKDEKEERKTLFEYLYLLSRVGTYQMISDFRHYHFESTFYIFFLWNLYFKMKKVFLIAFHFHNYCIVLQMQNYKLYLTVLTGLIMPRTYRTCLIQCEGYTDIPRLNIENLRLKEFRLYPIHYIFKTDQNRWLLISAYLLYVCRQL